MDEDSDQNLIDGNGSAADYDAATGGGYAYVQDPATAFDNGAVNNDTTGTGTAISTGTITPPAGGTSYTPPNWLGTLVAASGAASAAAQNLAPLINGKVTTGPAAAGIVVPASATTVSLVPTSSMTIYVVLAAIGAALFFLLRGRKA